MVNTRRSGIDKQGLSLSKAEGANRRDHYMYVVRCSDNTLYTGYAADVLARVQTHNEGNGAKYTACRRPVVLEAYATFESRSDAQKAEARFKKLTREEKFDLLAQASSTEEFTALVRNKLSL